MSAFYQLSSLWQTVLLVASQFALVSLTAGALLLFMRKSSVSRLVGMTSVFLLNAVLYVLMQLDSRLTGAQQGLHLHIPYGAVILIVLLSMVFCVRMILNETRQRKTISHSSIKESFDNLPTGVCFFNGAGLPVLCNLAMQRFSFAVCGKDVQLVSDLEECLAEGFLPANQVKREGSVFVLPEGRAWHLEKRFFTHESGNEYIQFVAADVTDLHKSRVALQNENDRLRRVQEELKRLSANVVTVTREEEILNTKMRIHDEMGRCLVAAQKYLKEDCTEIIPDSVAVTWQRAVAMIKYSNDSAEEDMLLQIRKTCAYMNIAFVQTGILPQQEHVAYLLTCAVRECVTNAVRYAEATELYAVFSENENSATVSVTNNGKIPTRQIVEGGGRSTLRRRVERAGGMMNVQSFPQFQLTVTVPKEKEGVL